MRLRLTKEYLFRRLPGTFLEEAARVNSLLGGIFALRKWLCTILDPSIAWLF